MAPPNQPPPALTQAQITKAFQDALGTGTTKGSVVNLLTTMNTNIKSLQKTGVTSTTTTQQGSTPPPPKTPQSGTKTASANTQAITSQNNLSKAANNTKSVFEKLTDPLKDVVAEIDNAFQAVEKLEAGVNTLTGPAVDMYDKIQQGMGGLSDFSNITNESVLATKQNFEANQDIFFTMGEDLSNLSSDLKTTFQGEEVNVLYRVFDDQYEALEAARNMANNFFDTYQLRYNELNETQKAQLITYEKGLGLSSQNIAKIVQRQIQRTGQAGTESLEKISAYSKQVAAATGVSFKQIADGIATIITNVRTFGNIQEEEAARIAGTLQQLGTSYQSFGNMPMIGQQALITLTHDF